MTPDRIERQVLLRSPLQRVWEAISDSKQFGYWFGVDFDGPFVAGATMKGLVTPTRVDPEIAKHQVPHTGKPFLFTIERIEQPRLFSFRWHPFAVEPGRDYSAEPTTLVEFRLQTAAEGTLLTMSESGFDQIPLERRVQAFQADDHGWTMQAMLIRKYLEPDPPPAIGP